MPKFNNFIEDLERVKLYIDNDLEKYAAELSTTPEQLQTTYARCKEIADSLGIVELKMLQSTLSGYELGTHEPDGQTLLRLADFYGVTVDYLLRGTEDE